MAKVFGLVFLQRLLLFAVACLAVLQGPLASEAEITVDKVLTEVSSRFLSRSQWPELKEQAYGYSHSFRKALSNPFMTIYRGISLSTKWKPGLVLFLISNLFFIWFISELYVLLLRKFTYQQTFLITALVTALPWNYELNLLSEYSFFCFLVVLSIHRALLNRWHASAFALALACYLNPMMIFLGLLILGIFVFYHRQHSFRQWGPHLLLFFGVLILFLAMEVPQAETLRQAWRESFFATLIAGNAAYTTAFSKPGEWTLLWFVLSLFVVGCVYLWKKLPGVHRIIPPALLVLVLAAVPLSALRAELSVGGMAMAGFVAQWGKKKAWYLYLALVALVAAQVYVSFRTLIY